MAARFLLECELEQFGLKFQEGASEDAMQEQLKRHKARVCDLEYSSASQDVLSLLPPRTGDTFFMLPDLLRNKLLSMLKEVEASSFTHEARILDVFIMGKIWGEAFEFKRDFLNAQTFYEAACRVAECPAGRKALPKVYGEQNMAATAHQFTALLLKKQRRYNEAERLYLKVLDMPSVPLLLKNEILHQLSKLYLDTQDAATLKNLYKRWKKLLEASKTPADCLVYWQYYQSEALFARNNRNFAKAITNFARVVALFETAYGRNSWLLTRGLLDLGRSYMDQMKLEDSYATFERGLKICEQTPHLTASEEKPELEIVHWLSNPVLRAVKQQHLQSHFLGAMGEVRNLQGRDADALSLYERAFRMNYDPEELSMGAFMRSYSMVLSCQGRKKEELVYLERACNHMEKAAGPTHSQTLIVKGAYAEALTENQRIADAAVVLKAARLSALASLGPANQVTQHIEMLLKVVRHALNNPGLLLTVTTVDDEGTSDASETAPLHYPDVLTARCGSCKRVEAKEEKFKVCSRCKRAKYCSGECQKGAWKEHKKGCRPLPV